LNFYSNANSVETDAAASYPSSLNPYIAGSLNCEFWRHGWEWINNDDVELPLRGIDLECVAAAASVPLTQIE
jgi:hypothetical protein